MGFLVFDLRGAVDSTATSSAMVCWLFDIASTDEIIVSAFVRDSPPTCFQA